ncbi:MAG: DedA family protein [Chloroflexi bacterium]|nr:DedA family protein [Chloroflexota bacterium]
MNVIKFFIDFILHIDVHLTEIINSFGLWSYAILFVIIFIETGLVVTPFLPGDSLLFAAGALANITGAFDIKLLYLLMVAAAILGDTANYWIGHFIGPKVFTQKSRWFKKEYMDRTQAFYEKHGGKAIFLARFVPIVRTFAPFVAGIGKMRYGYFISYNIIGGILWPAVFLFGGYFFGSNQFVQDHFSLVAVVIILISIVPIFIEWLKSRKNKPKSGDIKNEE